MPKATEPLSTTPTRRVMLGRMAAAAPLAALAAAPALAAPALAAPADPHATWMRELARLRDWFNGPESEALSDAEKEPVGLAMDRLEDLVCLTPARTPAGAAEQVRHVVRRDAEGCAPGEGEMAALANALATLDRLAGRA